MQQVADLPADQGLAGQRQVGDVRPEGGGSALFVSSQNYICVDVRETPNAQDGLMQKHFAEIPPKL